MSSTEVAHQAPVQILLDLERSGAITPVALRLTDVDLPYERWEDIGRFFGSLDRRSRFYIGDWLLFGEAVYGERAAQGVEATTAERYSEAERVTGLDHGTLMNIRSVCFRVGEAQRREELGFWMHAEVAALDPQDQSYWLEQAVQNGWTKSDLRAAIRDAKKTPPEGGVGGGDDAGAGEGSDAPSKSERIENAARLVVEQASNDSQGDWLVPSEAMTQLRASLGLD